MRTNIKGQRGQGMTEYIIAVALIAICVMVGFYKLGNYVYSGAKNSSDDVSTVNGYVKDSSPTSTIYKAK